MYLIISVVIMSLVTYIPRALPLAFIKKEIKSNFIKSFLYYIPYAVLASLTFPAVFYSTENFYTALIGTIVAILLAFFKQKLIVVATISVLVVFGLSYLL